MTAQRWRSVSTATRRLGAAVRCIDAVTGRPPHGRVFIRWEERDIAFDRTPSGHYVVTDLPADVTEITVAIRTPDEYLDVDVTIDEVGTVEDPLEGGYSGEEVVLYPSPSYYFGRNATLVRGSVIAEGEPVEAAECWIETSDADTTPSFTAESRSDSRGEFVLPVLSIGAGDVIKAYQDGTSVDDRPLVHVDEEQPTVIVAHPETGESVEQSVVLPEGDTVRLDISL